jgi:lysophospholipase L1-like esterase
LERRELTGAETLIIHVGTNDLKTTRNLDFIMGEVHMLVSTVKKKLPNCKSILSGVLRRRDVPWRRSGNLNDRLSWVANTMGLTFVDPNIWIEDGDFGGDGVHLNGKGKRHLGNLYARVSGLEVGGSAESMQ